MAYFPPPELDLVARRMKDEKWLGTDARAGGGSEKQRKELAKRLLAAVEGAERIKTELFPPHPLLQ